MVGVYKIENTRNGKIYVGSSVNIENRRSAHLSLLARGVHKNRILQNSYNKYGPEAFTFSVLEECLVDDLISREQYYADSLKAAFNIRSITVSSNLGLKYNRTKEELEEYKLAHKEAVTTLTREKMRTYRHFSGKTHKDSTKRLMAIKRSKTVEQYSRDGVFIQEWESALVAGKVLTVNRSSISDCCCGRRKTAGNFIWKHKVI